MHTTTHPITAACLKVRDTFAMPSSDSPWLYNERWSKIRSGLTTTPPNRTQEKS